MQTAKKIVNKDWKSYDCPLTGERSRGGQSRTDAAFGRARLFFQPSGKGNPFCKNKGS